MENLCMRLHRFYIKELNGDQQAIIKSVEGIDTLEITDTGLINQIKNVFRYEIGDELIIFGDGYDHLCSIMEIDRKVIKISKGDRVKSKNRKDNIVFAVSLPKKDKFEWIVEKLSEIGVSSVIPLISERTEKTGIQSDRLNRISIEATEQSGQDKPMNIGDIQKLEQFLDSEEYSAFDKYYLDFDGEDVLNFKNSKDNLNKNIIILVGPEGGWGELDKELFIKHNIKSFNIGSTVLRTETAAIVAAGIFCL